MDRATMLEFARAASVNGGGGSACLSTTTTIPITPQQSLNANVVQVGVTKLHLGSPPGVALADQLMDPKTKSTVPN